MSCGKPQCKYPAYILYCGRLFRNSATFCNGQPPYDGSISPAPASAVRGRRWGGPRCGRGPCAVPIREAWEVFLKTPFAGWPRRFTTNRRGKFVSGGLWRRRGRHARWSRRAQFGSGLPTGVPNYHYATAGTIGRRDELWGGGTPSTFVGNKLTGKP